ncbi:hypothetical protein [Viridibacillus arvi]|uniref:hypothetical protein n=1 Tax=Viridibacillus arvi TaxID=263475 RepID=UPI0006A98CD4|nr:hypothetical protein [Viridibacillus arvi]
MRRYLSMISLVLIIAFIILGFIIPQVLGPLPDISSLGMLALLAITIFAICMMLFGNFGT